MREDLVQGVERGIDRPVARRLRPAHLAVDLDLQLRPLRPARSRPNVERDEPHPVPPAQHLIVHEGGDVVVVDNLLAVGEVLEAAESVVKLVIPDLAVAERPQLVAEGGAAGVLAHDEVRLVPADAFRRHDLVGGRVLEDTILVDAALVREGVAPDDRLVGLHVEARDARQHLGQVEELPGAHARAVRHPVLADADRHDRLLQRRVACALADAVDGAFHLAHARANGGQCVRDGEAEVVVVVRGEDHSIGARHALAELREDPGHVLGQRVAHRIRDVDRGRSRLDRGLDAAAEEVDLGAAAVLRGPLHVVCVAPRQRHGRRRHLQHGLRLDPELVLDVERRGADEGVDALALRRAHGLGGAQDVLAPRPREAADHGAAHGLGNALDALEVARARDGEARLDHVDAQLSERLRHAQLLAEVHGEARRLLAVAQRRVEDDDAVVRHRAEAGVIHGHGIGSLRFSGL